MRKRRRNRSRGGALVRRGEHEEPAFSLGGEEDGGEFAGEAASALYADEDEGEQWIGGPALVSAASQGEEDEEAPTVISPLRFAVRCLLATAITFSFLSVYLYTHPATARSALAHLPLVGRALTEVRVAPADIELRDVRGQGVRLRDGRLAFIITGRAENDSLVPVRKIQIEGRLYSTRGEVGRQLVFCGAAVSPGRVRQLSAREVELLQSLEPPRDYMLAPGDGTRFMVAFLDPPRELSEFTVKVVSASFSRAAGG